MWAREHDERPWDVISAEVMGIGDRIATNGELTLNELSVMLDGTPHEGFAKWLLHGRNRMFKAVDANHDHALSLDELRTALLRCARRRRAPPPAPRRARAREREEPAFRPLSAAAPSPRRARS